MPAMIIGTIDLFHCMSFSMTMTFAEGHKDSKKQIVLGLFSGYFSTDHCNDW